MGGWHCRSKQHKELVPIRHFSKESSWRLIPQKILILRLLEPTSMRSILSSRKSNRGLTSPRNSKHLCKLSQNRSSTARGKLQSNPHTFTEGSSGGLIGS